MEPLWILRCFIFYIVINPLFQVHTFEEVIMTLQRAVDCDRNQVPSHVIYDISNIEYNKNCVILDATSYLMNQLTKNSMYQL